MSPSTLDLSQRGIPNHQKIEEILQIFQNPSISPDEAHINLPRLREVLVSTQKLISCLDRKISETINVTDDFINLLKEPSNSAVLKVLLPFAKDQSFLSALSSDFIGQLSKLDAYSFDRSKFTDLLRDASSKSNPGSSANIEEMASQSSLDVSNNNQSIKHEVVKVFTDIKGLPSKSVKLYESVTLPDLIVHLLKKFHLSETEAAQYYLALGRGDMQPYIFPNDEYPYEFLDRVRGSASLADTRLILKKKPKEGGIIRIFNENNPEEGFKSFHITAETTCAELIPQIVKKFRFIGDDSEYDVFEIIAGSQKCIKPDEFPLLLLQYWESKGYGDKAKYVIRDKASTLIEKMLTTAEVVTALRTDPLNENCADCNEPNPTFISINYGATLCRRCAAAHHELHKKGDLYSKIRPIRYYTWTASLFEIIKRYGNALSANTFKPTALFTSSDILEFVENKYSSFPELSTNDLTDALYQAIDSQDFPSLLRILSLGASANRSKFGRLSPLHEASLIGDPVIVELLLATGANPLMEDPHGYTPLFYLYAHQHEALANKLREYQLLYSCIIHRASLTGDNSEILGNFAKATRGLFSQSKLMSLDEDELTELLNDTMIEIEERSYRNIGVMLDPSGIKSAPAARLAMLSDVDFRELADNVFEELNIREFINIHWTAPRVDDGGVNSDEWILQIKTKQLREKGKSKSVSRNGTLKSGKARNSTSPKTVPRVVSPIVIVKTDSDAAIAVKPGVGRKSSLSRKPSIKRVSTQDSSIITTQKEIILLKDLDESAAEKFTHESIKSQLMPYLGRLEKLAEAMVTRSREFVTDITVASPACVPSATNLLSTAEELSSLSGTMLADPAVTFNRAALGKASSALNAAIIYLRDKMRLLANGENVADLSKAQVNRIKFACCELVRHTKILLDAINSFQKE